MQGVRNYVLISHQLNDGLRGKDEFVDKWQYNVTNSSLGINYVYLAKLYTYIYIMWTDFIKSKLSVWESYKDQTRIDTPVWIYI